jgi:glyoxylate/hydroxypyruvate reductase A
MTLLIKPGRESVENWIAAIGKALPDIEIRIWPDVGDRAEVEFILANELPPGAFATFPNLRFVAGTAVGVERLLKDPDLPPDIPILRQVNTERAATMAGWVLYQVLGHHRRFDEYRANQAARHWEHLRYPSPVDMRVGVMGLGTLGGTVARRLRDLMYAVAGWTRSRKEIEGIESFAGPGEFRAFLARTDILVSILPNTRATQNLLGAEELATLPEGAYVVNCGRGTLIDEDALLAAIDSGHLSGAALDVFRTEPLPDDHPFWSHPKVTVTPHFACMGRAAFGAANLVENIRRARAGRLLTAVVDKAEGY